MEKVLDRLCDGDGGHDDIELLRSVANQIRGKTLCALGEFAINPVLSTIEHFPEEYSAKTEIKTMQEDEDQHE